MPRGLHLDLQVPLLTDMFKYRKCTEFCCVPPATYSFGSVVQIMLTMLAEMYIVYISNTWNTSQCIMLTSQQHGYLLKLSNFFSFLIFSFNVSVFLCGVNGKLWETEYSRSQNSLGVTQACWACADIMLSVLCSMS